MAGWLFKSAQIVVTMDDAATELADADILLKDGVIAAVAPGMRADLALWDVSGIESAGSWDPAALLLAGPREVRHLFVEGRQVVRDGRLTTVDLAAIAQRQRKAVMRLAEAN